MIRNVLPLIIIMIMMMIGHEVLAQGATEASFPLGTYWPWERLIGHAARLGVDKWHLVDQRLDDMKSHSIDTLWVVNLNIKDLGTLAKRLDSRHMKLIPALGELHYNIEGRRNNWKYLEKVSRQALDAARRSQAIMAWALCDEPPKGIASELEQFRRKFEEWGAKQPGIVVTSWADTMTYIRESGFRYACMDIYAFFSDKNPRGPNPAHVSRGWYRQQVETTVKAALEKNRVPWIMPQMFAKIFGPWKYDRKGDMKILPGGVLHWRVPTVGETRWQVWSALGLGAQGLIFYVYESPIKDNAEAPAYAGTTFPETMKATVAAPMGSGGLIRPNGSATPQYEALAATFTDVRRLLPLLSGSKPMDIKMVQVSAPGWVGVLRNEALKKTLYVLVNDDTENAHELKLTGQVEGLRDLRTGKDLKADKTGVLVKLNAGEGTVLKVGE